MKDSPPPFGGGLYLVDSCAWIKLHRADAETQSEFSAALESGQLAVCPVVLLEVLRGARPQEYLARNAALRGMRVLPTTEAAFAVALDAQKRMAVARPDGQHRTVAPGDWLIAATAAEHGYGVLHYDADFDLITPDFITFDNRWLAPRGSI